MSVHLHGETLSVQLGNYHQGGISMQLIDEEGLPYATATVWYLV